MFSKGNFNYSTDYYSLSFQKEDGWLHMDWKGFQPKHSVPEGCDLVLNTLTNFKLSKVLNINTNVKGLWDADWVAFNWFPRMRDAGLEHFAWVLSPELLCAEVAIKVTKLTPVTNLIKTFQTTQEAEEWLRTI